MGEFETASQLDPIGGREDPMRPDTTFDSIPVGSRDAQTDARTMAEAAGAMSDELDMSGVLSDADVSSIMDEKRRGGWTNLTHPVGGMPAPASTSGTRGAEDIGKG